LFQEDALARRTLVEGKLPELQLRISRSEDSLSTHLQCRDPLLDREKLCVCDSVSGARQQVRKTYLGPNVRRQGAQGQIKRARNLFQQISQ